MYGYQKAVRLVLLEYVIVLLLHVIYAYFHFGAEPSKGLIVFVSSCALVALAFIISILIKNEAFVVGFIYFSISISTTIIGCSLHTLGHAPLIFLAATAGLTVFMERRYILVAATCSAGFFLWYAIFLNEYLLYSVDSLFIYFCYCMVYFAAASNMYIIVRYARNYMSGMEEKALEAERANDSKMLFLANMSHEIRTPMNAICGMAELNLREELSETVRENTENIQNSGRILLAIVNDILDYSKMESGKMEIFPVTYSLSHLIKDTISMMQIRLEDKAVDLRYEIDDSIPDILIGDEVRVRQILFNLLSNAIKFTDNGYILLKVESEKAEENSIYLNISVSDSGIGIRKEDLEKLFVSFQQIDTHKSHAREGTGLGLAICKELVTLMNGSINVESSFGVGSKFSFSIKQKVSDKKERLVYSERQKDNTDLKLTVTNSKVLVVDDNAVNLKVAEGLLKTFGLVVDTCKSGRECLSILNDHQDYDMIFLDHMMPELDGIETLNLIRANKQEYFQKVPIVALTANVLSGVREMFIEEGFDDYVPKPIDMVWMNTILRKYIPLEKQQ